MLRPARFSIPAFVCSMILLIGTAASFAQSVPLINSPVDESQRVVLRGNTRPEANATNDRGAVDESFPLEGIELLLKRSPEHEQEAATLADELQRPGSPQFHKWLTADEYARQFGVHSQDIATISEWLRSHGFTVDNTSPMTITFSGTAGQVKEAFGTEIHTLEVKGQRHIANMSDPSIPVALAPATEGVVSLNDFRPHKQIAPKAQFTFQATGGYTAYDVVPADLAKIYDFNPLFALGITGRGQTIALIEDSDAYNPAGDWNTFRQTFGLDAYKGASLETIHPGQGCADPGINTDDDEAILDAEWASAAAPSAQLELVACSNTPTTFGGLIAVQNLANRHQVPAVISISYANCEVQNGAASNAAYKAAYQQAVLEGVSVFVGAGDNGAAMCDYSTAGPAQSGIAVSALASTVYNVAVGGTDFGDTYSGNNSRYWSASNGPTYGSALGYVPEIPWNDACVSNLVTTFLGYETPFGADGFCASTFGQFFLYPAGGGGGPSNCATGVSNLGVFPPTMVTFDFPTPSDGSCRGWKKPAWQNVLGNPNDGVRDLPDVSMFAADGAWSHEYVYCNSDPVTGFPCVGGPLYWSGNGGTSFATPIMAGIQALVNQTWGGRQGNPAPIYYTLANLEYGNRVSNNCGAFATGGPAPSCIFHDITIGGNNMDCTGPYDCFDPGADQGFVGGLSTSDNKYQPAFNANVGWDFATGLGSVNAFNLVLNPIWLFGGILP
jgi:subtilase family serine protease